MRTLDDRLERYFRNRSANLLVFGEDLQRPLFERDRLPRGKTAPFKGLFPLVYVRYTYVFSGDVGSVRMDDHLAIARSTRSLIPEDEWWFVPYKKAVEIFTDTMIALRERDVHEERDVRGMIYYASARRGERLSTAIFGIDQLSTRPPPPSAA